MKKLLIALSIVLLMFMFVGCSSDNPAPGNPDTGTDEPTIPVDPDPEPEPEPEPEAREFIPIFDPDFKWVGTRTDEATNKDYKLEIVPFENWDEIKDRWFPVTFNSGVNAAMPDETYSTQDRNRFAEGVFGVRYNNLSQTLTTYYFNVYYHDEAQVINAENPDKIEYYPYYIRFAFGIDLSSPESELAQAYTYNRFVYATVTDEFNLFEYQDGPARLVLIPTGTDEQNEYFTEEVKETILQTWYDSIFTNMWSGDAGIGVATTELIKGTAENPEVIQFTIDEEIPDIPHIDLENRTPYGIVNIEFTRESIYQ